MFTGYPKHAVLDGTAEIDYTNYAIAQLEHAPATIGELADLAFAKGLRHVWLAPSAGWQAFQAPEFWTQTENANGIKVKVSGYEDGTAALLSHEGKIFCRVMRTDDPRWGLVGNCAAYIALSLGEVRAALDSHPVISPATTGLNALKSLLTRLQWLPEAVSWHQDDFATRDVRFLRRDLNPDRYTYLHQVDRNGAYLNAARAADFGTSGATRETAYAGMWDALHDAGGYGIAEVIVRGMSPRAEELLPVSVSAKEQVIAFPVLQMLHDVGADYTLLAVTRYKQVHRVFRRWAEPLAALRSAETLGARHVGKAIATQTIGMFGHERTEGPQAWHYRPDWRAHIVATNALTFARMIRRLDLDNLPVIAAYTDSIAFLSTEPDPPEYLTEHSASLGGYKRVQTLGLYEMRALVRMAQNPDLNVVGWLKAAKDV